MHKLSLIMHSTNTIFIDWVCITLTKLHVNFQSDPLQSVWAKEEKLQNKHINYAQLSQLIPLTYSFLEKFIFVFR